MCAWPVKGLQLGRSLSTSGRSLGMSVAVLRAQAQPKGPNLHSQQHTDAKESEVSGLLEGTKVLARRLDSTQQTQGPFGMQLRF